MPYEFFWTGDVPRARIGQRVEQGVVERTAYVAHGAWDGLSANSQPQWLQVSCAVSAGTGEVKAVQEGQVVKRRPDLVTRTMAVCFFTWKRGLPWSS